MKKLLVFLLIGAITTTSFAQQRAANIRTVTAKQVKAFMDTSTVPIIINFWASWCGPCIREIPYFESQVAGLQKPVKLLLVSIDYPEAVPTKLAAFLARKNYRSEVWYLNETDLAYFTSAIDSKWTGAIPASIFIDNSKKYYAFFNSQLTEARLELELQKLIE